MQTVLVACRFPFASFPVTQSASTKVVQRWLAACSSHVPKDFSMARLEPMLWDFFNANKDTKFISTNQIVQRLTAAIAQPQELQQNLPLDLLKILVGELSLW